MPEILAQVSIFADEQTEMQKKPDLMKTRRFSEGILVF